MLRRLLGERISIVTQSCRDLHSLMADATQLEQIAVNLSVNARDAMPDGGTLTLATHNFDAHEGALPHPNAKPGPYVRLSVTDTGTGMTPEVRAKIFDVFFAARSRCRLTTPAVHFCPPFGMSFVKGFDMRKRSLVTLAVAAVLMASCGKRIPQPASVAPGTPSISWIIMHGDRDNADREFACQSNPRSECVMPASAPDAQAFSHVYVYYHGAGADTKYTGSFQLGFLQGAPEAKAFQANITVKKGESITNQSVTGIVTSTPGTYAVTFDLVATQTGAGQSQPIRESISVIVK